MQIYRLKIIGSMAVSEIILETTARDDEKAIEWAQRVIIPYHPVYHTGWLWQEWREVATLRTEVSVSVNRH